MTTPDILHQMFRQDGPRHSVVRCEVCSAYTTRQKKNLVRLGPGKYGWKCPRCRRVPFHGRVIRLLSKLL